MEAKEQAFLDRLRTMFRTEAEEHLRVLSASLITLEQSTAPEQRTETVEAIYREVHSMKGAARSVNLKEVESVCQALESALSALKRAEIAFTPALADLLLSAVDSLTQLVATMGADRTSADRIRLRELSRRLTEASQNTIATHEPAPPVLADSSEILVAPRVSSTLAIASALPEPWPVSAAPTVESQHPAPNINAEPVTGVSTARKPTVERRSTPQPLPLAVETVRIPITKLDPLLLQAEELIQVKLATSQRNTEMRDIQLLCDSWKTEAERWKGRRAMTSVGGAGPSNDLPEWAALLFDALAGKVTAVSHALEQDERTLSHMVDDHLEALKQILMLPASTMLAVLPRLVRDVAHDQGKEVDLVLRGAEIEIDKRILEELKDPLIHLLRNSVDHGIEQPEVRVAAGKTERGLIMIIVNALQSRQVEIVISDDGAGINADRVREAGIRSGAITPDAAQRLTPQETMALIFQSGLSTSDMITDISGRGLGLAIVREKVESLGGQVVVESSLGVGTTFRLLLPMRLANFRGVQVLVHGQVFVIPTSNIEHVVRVSRDDIRTVENRESIQIDGRILALAKLSDVLGMPARNEALYRKDAAARGGTPTFLDGEVLYVPVLVLIFSDRRIAVQVDEVLAEEEILLKSLGLQLSRVRNIAGATVLGTGKVAPVLNVFDLMASALKTGGTLKAPVSSATERVGRIMVAEDSITARTLLKNILESNGYQVTTAVDGADAFSQLRVAEFDLVVSDVDMPRLSGFELTTKIRADKKLSELPVILVTALDSRQDRERGIEVGANAYIIKRSFDQSNLLEVIRRLL